MLQDKVVTMGVGTQMARLLFAESEAGVGDAV
jgi:hypothetical protein